MMYVSIESDTIDILRLSVLAYTEHDCTAIVLQQVSFGASWYKQYD